MIQNKTPGFRRRKSAESGFTLIETIITIIVLSIAAIGVLTVFTIGTKGSASPLILDQAIALAQEKMDETIALRKSGGFAAVAAVPAGPFAPPVAGFTWSRTVNCVTAVNDLSPSGTPPCPPAAEDYELVTITVTHTVTGDVQLTTLMTNY
jgi:prepilin-type N-terminal cleavage/methylation domain-containing protein